jgi:hypothetical protein
VWTFSFVFHFYGQATFYIDDLSVKELL